MNKLYFSILVAMSITLSACSSNNDNATTSTNDKPVTGEIHNIQPNDVENYIANFEAQRARISFNLDANDYSLTFLDEDSENDALIAQFNGNDILVISFDLENLEPLPSMAVIEVAEDGETSTRTWAGNDLSLQETIEGDFQYTGRLTDQNSDAEIDVNLVFNESLVTAGSSSLTVSGTDALLNGDMGTQTYIQMKDMIAANPNVTRLVIQQSSGSVNDQINMHTGRLIRAANLTTHVPAGGDINSGAVDLFAAGVSRTVEPGSILGVHSWCCKDGVTADKLAKSDPAHGAQLTYFREMLADNGEDFYFFTLEAAPFNGIHPMTPDEMVRYSLITE